MKLKIWQAGEPVLRQRARALTAEEICDDAVQGLIASMRETMRDAPGVGLAAPQVGVPLRLAVIEDAAEYMARLTPREIAERGRVPVPFHVVINPELSVEDDAPAEFFEGCLSVAGQTALVRRALRVRVECLNERAEPVTIRAEGWYARILQHEIDHLNGVLYVDRMWPRSFMTQENHARYWRELSAQQVRRACGETEQR